MVSKWKGKKTKFSDEDTGVGLDLYAGMAVHSAGGDETPSARRLELNFVVVLISGNKQKERFEIQLLVGWADFLQQKRLGSLQI